MPDEIVGEANAAYDMITSNFGKYADCTLLAIREWERLGKPLNAEMYRIINEFEVQMQINEPKFAAKKRGKMNSKNICETKERVDENSAKPVDGFVDAEYTAWLENLTVLLAMSYQETQEALMKEGNKAFFVTPTVQGSEMCACINKISKNGRCNGTVDAEKLFVFTDRLIEKTSAEKVGETKTKGPKEKDVEGFRKGERQNCKNTLLQAFPYGYFSLGDGFIAHPPSGQCFIFRNCNSVLDVKCKILEWFSRAAYKTTPYPRELQNRRFHEYMRNGINYFLGTDFTEEDMEKIYEALGNAVDHERTVRFVKSGYKFIELDPYFSHSLLFADKD